MTLESKLPNGKTWRKLTSGRFRSWSHPQSMSILILSCRITDVFITTGRGLSGSTQHTYHITFLRSKWFWNTYRPKGFKIRAHGSAVYFNCLGLRGIQSRRSVNVCGTMKGEARTQTCIHWLSTHLLCRSKLLVWHPHSVASESREMVENNQ